jgi:hypothetical protein
MIAYHTEEVRRSDRENETPHIYTGIVSEQDVHNHPIPVSLSRRLCNSYSTFHKQQRSISDGIVKDRRSSSHYPSSACQ